MKDCFYKPYIIGLVIALLIIFIITSIINYYNIKLIASQLKIDTIQVEDYIINE